MTVIGESVVPVDLQVLEGMTKSFLGELCDNIIVRFDARANVKSTYGKLTISGNLAEVRIYTGAIKSTWDEVFTTSSGFNSDFEVFLFVYFFLLRKYKRGIMYNVTVKCISEIMKEVDYVELKGEFESLKESYEDSLNQRQLNLDISRRSVSSMSSGRAKASEKSLAKEPLQEEDFSVVPDLLSNISLEESFEGDAQEEEEDTFDESIVDEFFIL